MYNGSEYVIFDFSRSQQEVLNYEVIEDIKNGIFNSTKYESKTVVTQKKTKIVCFMNFLPDMNKLSADRYHIMEINSPEINSL